MGFKMKGGGGADSDINVTPLIDVVLVLLIIFMVLTPRVIEEMSANLPSKTETVKNKDDNQQLVVAVYDNGETALNMKVLERKDLYEELRARLRSRPQKVVFLDAHPNLEYGIVVEVMDLVRDAGADRVGMARLKDEGPPRPAAESAPAPATP